MADPVIYDFLYTDKPASEDVSKKVAFFKPTRLKLEHVRRCNSVSVDILAYKFIRPYYDDIP